MNIDIHMTIAMQDGRQKVAQCGHCGTVVVWTVNVTPKLGFCCPACQHTDWRTQTFPIAGINLKEEK